MGPNHNSTAAHHCTSLAKKADLVPREMSPRIGGLHMILFGILLELAALVTKSFH